MCVYLSTLYKGIKIEAASRSTGVRARNDGKHVHLVIRNQKDDRCLIFSANCLRLSYWNPFHLPLLYFVCRHKRA